MMWVSGQVKQEGGVGEDVTAGLYAEHEIKQELVVGPEVLQPPDVAFPLRANRPELVIVKQENDAETPETLEDSYMLLGKCSKDFVNQDPVSTESCKEQLVLKTCTVRLERLEDKSKLHKNIHNAEKVDSKIKMYKATEDIIYSCNICSAQFTLKAKLIRHLRVCSKPCQNTDSASLKFSKEKLFSCISCKKEFKKKTELTRHNRVHTGERPYQCEICDKSYKRTHHLNRHYKTHVPRKLKNYTCDICQRQFTEKGNLVTHMLYHIGKKPYSCDFCHKRFIVSYHLKVHRRIHIGNTFFSCNICQKRFSSKRDATVHRKIHTGEKLYSCGVCQMQFRHKSSLTSHNRIHHTARREKWYTCKICKMQFTSRCNLHSHMKIHIKQNGECILQIVN